MKGSFYSIEPKSEFIRKYISHYYFHKSEDPNGSVSFSYYPHYKNALTIYKNSKLELVNRMHTRASPHDDGHSFNYSQLFKNFSKANIIGPFDKIGIVFQPLGINHFMSDNSSKFINDEINVNFNYFQKTLSPVLEKVFAENSLEAKIDLLDGYFLNHLSEVEDKRISNAITIIFQSDEKLSAQDLSDSLNINRKTLLRLFNRHLNCSPKDYIILIQFRKAVELYQNASHKPSLTRLALDLDYYDQSDFIHRFTKITGVNPTKLFNNLKEFGVHSTYWSTN